ncbi:MAG: hypothetical protein ACUZ77_10965 [Candidatus Brocadiales bacterium]
MKHEHSIKISALVCLIICIMLSGCAFSSRLRQMNIKDIEQPGVRSTSVSRGYLASGPTIKVQTETAESEGTFIEQFEKTSKELQENKERLSSLEKEFEKLKISKEIIQTELKDNNKKLVIAQQILMENEILNNKVESLKMDLSALLKQIKQLNEILLKVQISEVKTKQELVNARIQHLQEKKRTYNNK